MIVRNTIESPQDNIWGKRHRHFVQKNLEWEKRILHMKADQASQFMDFYFFFLLEILRSLILSVASVALWRISVLSRCQPTTLRMMRLLWWLCLSDSKVTRAQELCRAAPKGAGQHPQSHCRLPCKVLPLPVPGTEQEAVLGLMPQFLKMLSENEGIVSISNTIQELDNGTHTAVKKYWPQVRKISGENIVKGI